ncbi:MAG: DUF1848 domain-containing protein [Oscillospiraceae bacterium]|nr:DUF1848 domain-containing protein [Oscillospiraceae bacterium]
MGRLVPYYFQYAITPYHSDVETGLAGKKQTVIPAFLKLAEIIGPKRIIWRYDPIIITPRYSYDYHIRAFAKLCGLLAGSTEKCVISFVIAYPSIAKNLSCVNASLFGVDVVTLRKKRVQSEGRRSRPVA